MILGFLAFIGFIVLLFIMMERQDKNKHGDYTMGKYQLKASEGAEIKKGKASSTSEARKEGYSKGFQDGEKAYRAFLKLVILKDLKLEDGLKPEYKDKFFDFECPYDWDPELYSENEYADRYLDEYSYEYRKGYRKGYNDAYDFNLKRNGRLP
jgi:hypothetical protein